MKIFIRDEIKAARIEEPKKSNKDSAWIGIWNNSALPAYVKVLSFQHY
jgi:hypothetical protein